MGIATTHLLLPCHSKQQILVSNSDKSLLINSMSEDYHNHHHQGFFSNFSNGFERSQQQQQHLQQHQHHMSQQIRRDKLRIQGFHEQQQPPPPHPPPPPLDAIEEVVESTGLNPVYETAGMLSEMFNFTTTAAGDISNLENNYRNSRPPPPATAESQWYGNNRQLGLMMGGNLGPLDETKNQNIGNHDRDSTTTIATSTTHQHHHRHQHHHPQQISGNINADSASAAAAAMHLFLMNPQPRSPSPPPPAASSSTLHMLLPNQGFHPHPPQFHLDASEIGGGGGGGIVEGQGLSLSLSSSLQHLEKAEELRMGGDGHGMIFFNQGGGGGTSIPGAQYPNYKNMGAPLHLQSPNNQVHVGYGSSIGMVNVLRNSKYAKAAQELLEEFCSVGRGHLKKNKLLPKNNNNPNPNSSNQSGGGNGGGGNGGNSSSSSKDLPPLSASDRLEHQRRKVKLLTMLDEVDRRYNHYCEQMQMVVNSFDLVMGFGAAIPYTALAQKAMSRHFRCLKDAIAAQLKQSCEMLGEKDAGTSGVTKGETPRLRLLEQSLRQQRAFHQMGMMEQEAWRPQRGLPERSVNILRAWLFEHFLHPYPSDADKHLLARQTGLSRNQVSNWFINARVRLWKPMVEDMYQQEAKEEEEAAEADDQEEETTITQTTDSTTNIITQTPTPTNTATANTAAITSSSTRSKRSEINDSENDPSLIAINTHCSFPENQAKSSTSSLILPNTTTTTLPPQAYQYSAEAFRRGGGVGVISGNPAEIGASHHLVRFGTNAGDVSLTLGLRHAGNLPQEKSTFSVRDFGGC